MAPHTLIGAMRLSRSAQALRTTTRSFQTSATRFTDAAAALPIRKPVGAFRGGLFGFLLGSTLTGAGVYYYVVDEYKVSNELLTEDIYSLQAAVQKVHAHIQTLEENMVEMKKKDKK